MNNKRHRNKLFTMLMLVMALFIPQWGWAQSHSYTNGLCTDVDCSDKYQPAKLNEKDDWYEISNAGQLYWFANEVDNGRLTTANVRLINDIIDNDVTFGYDEAKNYAPVINDGKQTVNILRAWNPIGAQDDVTNKSFGGHFDGNNHCISGLYYNNETSWGGLFVSLSKTAVIEKVKVINSYFRASVVGGIAANLACGKIEQCLNNSIIYGIESSGGIIGNTAEAENIYVPKASVNNCVNQGVICGEKYVGGLIGTMQLKSCVCSCSFNIGDCYNKNSTNTPGEIAGYSEQTTWYGYFHSDLFYCFGHGTDKVLVGSGKANEYSSQLLPIEAFYSGKLAYLLSLCDNKWGQDLNTSNSIPIYGKKPVFKICTEDKYTNEASEMQHSYDEKGFCKKEKCTEKYQPANFNELDGWYEIANAGQLYWFAEQVDNGNIYLTHANVRLINNIVDNDVTLGFEEDNDYKPIVGEQNNNVNTLRMWNPIGMDQGAEDDVKVPDENLAMLRKCFGGSFNGNGFSISGLYLNNENLLCGGLFGILVNKSIVENVKIENSYFRCKIAGSIAGTLIGGTVNQCTNDGIVYGKMRAGGILGQTLSKYLDHGVLLGEINVCYCVNAGTVYGNKIAGGIVGIGFNTYKSGNLAYLLNLGKVVSEDIKGETMGKTKYKYTLQFCFGHDSNNSLIGEKQNNYISITNSQILPITEFHNGKLAYQLSLSDEKWGQDLSQSESCPTYKGIKVYKLCGDNYTNDATTETGHNWKDGICTKCDDNQEAIFNTEKNSYEISNLGQLLWFDERFGLEGLKQDDYANAFLTSDITINKATLGYDGEQNKVLVNGDTDKESSLRGWKTLGNTHNFEGNGHTISGLYALTSTYSDNQTGFCNGEVQNLTLSNAVVIATTSDDIGGVTGRANSPIKNCHFKGVVKGSYVGGIACRSNNSITNCSFEGKIYDGKGGSKTLGGLVGENKGSISNCAFLGECINENKIVRLVGTNSGVISNCYLSSSTSESGNEKIPCTIVDANSGTIQKIAYDADKLTQSSEDDAFKAFTTEQIKSGEVAYWLNDNKSDGTQAWYQKLSEDGDAYPMMKSTGENTVYHGTKCNKITDVYTNDNTIFDEDGAIPHKNYHLATEPDANGVYSDVCVECNSPKEGVKYIKDFCGETGRNLKLAVGSDGSYSTEENIQLSDKAEYNSPVVFEVADFTYTRNNPHTEWQVYYVPFDIDYSELANVGITAAYINNFHEYTKNGETEVVLEVKEVTSGTLKANVPYVIKAATSGETQIHANNVMLHKAEAKALNCQSVTHNYSFKGIYKALSGFNQDENINNGIIDYTLKGGEFLELTKTATLSPMRWYLTICDRNKATETSSAYSARVRSVQIKVVGEGEATGIENIHVITDGNVSVNQGIYDLQGRRLSAEPAHGVYIKNGKKIIK